MSSLKLVKLLARYLGPNEMKWLGFFFTSLPRNLPPFRGGVLVGFGCGVVVFIACAVLFLVSGGVAVFVVFSSSVSRSR